VDASTYEAHSGWLITGNRISATNVAMSIQDLTASTVSGNTLTAVSLTNVLWTSERHDLAGLVFEGNVVSGSGGSMVSILTDYNQYGSAVPVEAPVINTNITGVTIRGNTFSNWGTPGVGRALRAGSAAGTGAVTGVAVTSNTFQMTVDRPEVIGGTGVLSATGSGNTFNVSGTAKIQKAVDAAFTGDTINVAAGTYAEHVTVDKAGLVLQHAPAATPVIDGGGSGVPVVINANNVTIDGFTVQNSGLAATDAGIVLGQVTGIGTATGVTGCTITHNTLTSGVKGIAVLFGSDNVISSNVLENNPAWGILLVASTGNTVESNAVSHNPNQGIVLENNSALAYEGYVGTFGSTGNIIRTNTITDTVLDEALFLGQICNDNVVTGNTIDDADVGIQVWRSNGQTITGNTVQNCDDYIHDGYAVVGIRLRNAQNNIITGNTVVANMRGFEIVANEAPYCTGNQIHGNNISENLYGMDVADVNGVDTTVVDASGNWWGSASGPKTPTNPTGTGGSVTARVNYSPWLGAALGTSPMTWGTNNSIQAAVEAAGAGDTINVAAGTYAEQVVVSGKNNLTISGAGPTTIIAPAYAENTAGIMVKHADGLTIKNLKVHTSGYEQQGIWVRGAFYDDDRAVTGLTIQDTTIEVDAASGICVDASTDAAHSGWTITGNDIDSAAVAMSIQDLKDSTVSGNSLTVQTAGTNVLWTSERFNLTNLVFTDNTVSGSGGVQVVIVTDYNKAAGSNVPVEGDPEFDSTITGVTIHGNTFSNWDTRAVKLGDQANLVPGTVTGISITNNIFNDDHSVSPVFGTATSIIGGLDAPSATGSGNTFNVSDSAKIQTSVGAAFSGDTINVAPGIYTEVGQISIQKDLTIVGAGKSSTIIKADADTGDTDSGDAKSWWLVGTTADRGITFNLSGVTLDGNGKKIFQGIRTWGSGVVQNVRFTDIRYNESTEYQGTGIHPRGGAGTNVDVLDCTFDNIGRIGALYVWGGTGTFARNTYTGKGLGNWMDYGVEVGGGSVINITDNTITACSGTAVSDGTVGSAIAVTTYFGPGTTAVVTGNKLTGNGTAIDVGYDNTDTSVIHAHGNTISGNIVQGVHNASALATMDATGNWWGTATGPRHATLNPSGTGNAVSDNVTFSPWLSRFEQTDSRVTYVGTWTSYSSKYFSGNSYAWLGSTGYADISFEGTTLDWIGRVGPGFGIAKVTMDDGTPEYIDLYSATNDYSHLIKSFSSPVDGRHTLRIEYTNTKNALSTGRLISVDAIDTEALASNPTRYEQTDTKLIYSGTWTPYASKYFSGGSYAWLGSTGYVDIAFTGTSLEWVGRMGPGFGIAKVTFDRGTPETVDLYSSSNVYSAVLKTFTSPVDGPHTVRIEYTGTKNILSTGRLISVDALDVVGELTQAQRRYEQTNTKLSYAGTWTPYSNKLFSGNSYAWLGSTGYVDISFTGTSLDWVGRTGPGFGIARVTFDGGTPETVDLYSSSNVYSAVLKTFTSPVNGPHTVRIEYTGTKNILSTGRLVSVDALDVIGELTQAP
jgi:parallel beta-helix repeat protein